MENIMIEELFEAVASKDLAAVIELAQQHSIDLVSIRNAENLSLLHAAAGYGRTNLVLYLIEQGLDVNVKDIEGQTPLHNACCHAHASISRILIEAGANVDLMDTHGWTPLHFALARKSNAERISPTYWRVIELLLKSGANPYLKTASGRSCLARIRNSEDRRNVRLLHFLHKLESIDHEDEQLRESIVDRYWSASDFFEMVKTGDGNLEILTFLTTQRLLNSRLDSCDSITPLHRAAGYNHLNLAQLFIQKGANVDATDNFGRIPLHNAAQYGHIEMIELLVNARSDINKQDLIGQSPLHLTASNITYTACLKLIELGANRNLRDQYGNLPYDLAQSDDVKEVLMPESLLHRMETPSTSDQAMYVDIQTALEETQEGQTHYSSQPDDLMLDSRSSKRLFANTNHTIKKIILNESDWRYQLIRKRMLETIRVHSGESGGRYSTYEILGIELIYNVKVWSKYKLMCQRLEIDYGADSINEKLLFHGSNFIDKIQSHGFDERYAQRNGMFGAGIYFAKHSSKSNQYTFGFGQGCQEHMDKSCHICEREMVYAQVALGRTLISKEAMPDCAHAPPGYSSVTGTPEKTENLVYPEYVIYSGDQAYPLYVIRYKIVP